MISQFSSIVLLAAGLFSAMAAGSANAQAIARQITLVVPYSAGGGTDTVARLIGNQMSRTLGQAIIVENVVGAGGTRRTSASPARSPMHHRADQPCGAARRAQPVHQSPLRHVKDFEAVGLVNNAPMLLVGRKSIPGERRRILWSGSSRRAPTRILRMAASAQTATFAGS